jgi:hypothetical protein
MNLLLRFATIALVAVGLSGVGKTAKSEIIAMWQQNSNSGRYGISTTLPVDLGDVAVYFDADPYLHWSLSNADVGQTIYRDAADPQFAAFVANLTNGIDNFCVFSTAGSSSASNESGIFGGVLGGNGIDLAGFQIDKVGLRVDSLAIVSPGSNPNGDGQWTDTSGQISFLFAGVRAVPEPSTYAMALAGLACGGYSMFRRRKRA